MTTIVDQDAPTVAELSAGMDLECQITPDGLGREASDETVDTSRLWSVFTTMQVGRTSFEVSVTLVRLDESISGVDDDAYHNLTKGTRGYLVIRDNLPASTGYAATQEVEVYPVQCGTRSKANPAANELQTFSLPLNVTGDPSLAAVVAA
ncbi:hypothetical protein [Pseudonocardia sp. N23]|uniref:phage tail tube protein n=1 Tax=Pseudonocardia sp. N23 TaxID=1987376 RepID=UPI000BFB37CB|nr:hypothetical protein [Pseudonocardia sp. N23]GAY07505.1 hypothetical protein TOK_3525 [Pseudonocardia sp. N23]